MKKQLLSIEVTYNEASIIGLTMNVYCNGPPYYRVKKMNDTNTGKINHFTNQLFKMKKQLRGKYPQLYSKHPLIEEALNKKGYTKVSIKVLNLVIRAFEATFKEYDYYGYYELEVLAAPEKEVRSCYLLLKEFQTQWNNVQHKKIAGHKIFRRGTYPQRIPSSETTVSKSLTDEN
jgi:hypothetical protein